MKRGKGYKPSSAAKLASFKHVRHLLGAGEPAFPPSAATSQFAPPVMDQSDTSSCTGHGTAVGVATALAFKGTPLPFVPSPKGVYDDVREMEAPGQPLQDEGAEPADFLKSLSANGVRAIRAPTSTGCYSDCESATINVPETDEENAESIKTLLAGEYMLDPRAADFPQILAACIAKGVPVGVAIPAEGAFVDFGEKNQDPDAVFDAPADFGQADHWVVVLDYRTSAAGALEFHIRNSWSESWNAGGSVWVSAAWLQAGCAEALAFDVSIQAAPCP